MAEAGQKEHEVATRNEAIASAFLTHLKVERRTSPHTVAAYRRDLSKLTTALNSAGIALEDATLVDIRQVVIEIRKAGLSAVSLARHLSSWRALYRYAILRHGFKNNPCQDVRNPKTPRHLPNTPTPEACIALLDSAPRQESRIPALLIRDRAMFELFYTSGIRLAELVGLDLQDMDLNDGTARVTGKGQKTRIVPVGKTAIRVIRDWLEERKAIAQEDEQAVFVSRGGTRLNTRSVQIRLAKWSRESGVGQHFHPHLFRHAFASHLLQESGNLRAVQEMLGHENIATTSIYTRLDWKHLAKTYDKAHPRAKRANSKKQDASDREDDD